ncbi:MAG: GNAT family N-acetyltransferase [Chloroflexi bacterium]|nr:GNAT family N-acetyltransferase [Chloroflexota bacterium]
MHDDASPAMTLPPAQAPCAWGYRLWATALSSLYNALLRVKGYTIRLARTPEEQDLVYRLRWRVYTEVGYLLPEQFPDGRFRDRADAVSYSWLAWWHDEPVGTVRATPLVHGIAPVFEYVRELPALRAIQARAAELGRYAVVPAHRKGVIAAGLILNIFAWAVTSPYAYLVWGASRRLARWTLRFSPYIREIPIPRDQINPTDIIGYFEQHPQVAVYIAPTCRIRLRAWLHFLGERMTRFTRRVGHYARGKSR